MIRHVDKAIIVEMHTTDNPILVIDITMMMITYMDASKDGGEVQRGNDYMNQIEAQEMLGLMVL